MKRSIFLAIALAATTLISTASAYDLQVPSKLTSLESSRGQQMFAESNAKQAYWKLSENYITQSIISTNHTNTK